MLECGDEGTHRAKFTNLAQRLNRSMTVFLVFVTSQIFDYPYCVFSLLGLKREIYMEAFSTIIIVVSTFWR